MTRNQAHEHLQLCTVKIESDYDIGSGFFIDKGLIVTCHHVIEDCSLNQLQIIWQGETYQALKIESNAKDDLALITLKINKKHPCVKLNATINPDDRCSFFGFPENHRDNGMIRNCEHEGTTKKLLAFKEGQFEHGFSGSAILNFETGKVCGVVNKTRDSYSNLGGYAIPLSKLTSFLKSKNYEIDDNGSIFSKEMFKNWVWTSSVESADRLQFSVLALVETLVAVGLSFFVWFYYDFYYHIIIGLIFSPLYFLKVNVSETKALIFFNKYGTVIKNFPMRLYLSMLFILSIFLIAEYSLYAFAVAALPLLLQILFWSLFIFPLYSVLMILFISIIIKLFFTVKYFSLKNILMIPKNLFKLILATDILHPLEILPGISKTTSEYRFGGIIKSFIHNIKKSNKFFLIITIIPMLLNTLFFFLLLSIPTLIFRYSLKSTSWIYLPLIWLIQPQDRQNLTTKLKIESKNFIAYLMFFYSLIVVFVFTFPPLIFPHTELGVYLQTLAIPKTLKTIFFAYEFNLWHLTRFLSALITIVFMVSFTKILIRRENGEPSYSDFWGAKLLSLRDIRSILTLITLGFTAYHILGLLDDNFFRELWANMKVFPEE